MTSPPIRKGIAMLTDQQMVLLNHLEAAGCTHAIIRPQTALEIDCAQVVLIWQRGAYVGDMDELAAYYTLVNARRAELLRQAATHRKDKAT